MLHLVRQELVPEATAAETAEVLTSGLFEVRTEEDGAVELSLGPEARDVLQEELAAPEAWRIHRALGRHVADGRARGAHLAAVAGDPFAATELPAGLKPFAEASLRVLALLGLAGEEQQDRESEAPTGTETETAEGGEPVGRASEARKLIRRLTSGDAPILSISGQGGSGKRTLARYVAHRARDHFPDGLYLVQLRAFTPGARGLRGVRVFATRLASEPGGAGESLHVGTVAEFSQFRQSLEGRRVLLVLEDVASEAEVLRELLPAAPGHAVLVTSRQSMSGGAGINGVWLGVLDQEDRLELLGRFAGRQVLESDPEGAVAVAKASGGMPLGIRLLGKWIASGRAPGLSELASRLREEAGATHRGRSAVDGVLTLRLNLLGSDEARTLLLISLMPTGRLTVRDAAALSGGNRRSTARVLDGLVDQALVEDGPHDIRQFHPTVLAFLRKKRDGYLPAGEAERALARLVALYVADTVHHHRAAHPGSRLAERLGLLQYADLATKQQDSPQELSDLLALVAAETPPSLLLPRAGLLLLLSEEPAAQRQTALYAQAVRAVLVDADRAGDAKSGTLAQLARARAELKAGNTEAAQQDLDDVDPEQAPAGLLCAANGHAARQRGDHERSKAWLFQALEEYERAGERYETAAAHLDLAEVHLEANDPKLAVSAAERAEANFRELGALQRAAEALKVWEEGMALAGRNEEVLDVQMRAARLYASQRMNREEARVVIRHARTLLALGRLAKGQEATERAILLLEGDAGDVSVRAEAGYLLGLTLRLHGDHAAARAAWQSALDGLGPLEGPAAHRLRLLLEPSAARTALAPCTVVALAVEGVATGARELRSATRRALAEVYWKLLAACGAPPESAELREIPDGHLLLVDESVPVAGIMSGLLELLPAELDALKGSSLTPRVKARLAVHMGPVDRSRGQGPSDRPDPTVREAYRLLESSDFRLLSDISSSARMVCASAAVFAVLEEHRGSGFLASHFRRHRITDRDGELTAWLQTPDRPIPKAPWFAAPLLEVQTGSPMRRLEAAEPDDEELRRLWMELLDRDPDGTRMGALLRDCLDAALGPLTGRYDLSQLQRMERTSIGFRVQEAVRREFGLDLGAGLDLRLGESDFDLRFSTRPYSWMFPRETMGQLCLVIYADDLKSTWSAGLLRVRTELLNQGHNRDGKRSLRAAARDRVHWLHRQAQLPENLLLHLDPETRSAILTPVRAQDRLAELFRRVMLRALSVSALRVVCGDQLDVRKHVRDARAVLEPEGIFVHSSLTRQSRPSGLPQLRKNEYMSVPMADHGGGTSGDDMP